MIYKQVLEQLDKDEAITYSRLRDDFITKCGDERYILKTVIELQNRVIEGYGKLFESTERTVEAARRIREYEEKKEEKYKAAFESGMVMTGKTCIQPNDKCSD